jgi:hypothetical protein
MRSNDGSVRPAWNEFYTFTLDGSSDESLLFEIFRHNSSEGDIQLDYFEVKLNEDPSFFELLSDQSSKNVTYYSMMQHTQASQPSFETDRTHSSNEEHQMSHPPSVSQFKVMFRWRHAEAPLKQA